MSEESRSGPPPLRFYLVALLLGAMNSRADVPDLLCQEVTAVGINPLTLKVSEFRSGQTMYRFQGGKLFFVEPGAS